MKTIVLLPTYNEKGNLSKLVSVLLKTIPTDILIIDDNSPDGTGAIADKLSLRIPNLKVLHRLHKEGLGRAYIEGYQWALAKEYDIIIQMDCDLSHDPKYLPAMLSLLKENDLVIGSRYVLGGGFRNWPLHRLLCSKYANRYVELLTGMPIKDATSGFKCFKCQVLRAIDIESIHSSGYSFQIETNYRAYKKKFKLKEFPIIFYDRAQGASKISRYIIIEAFFLVLKIFFRVYKFQ